MTSNMGTNILLNSGHSCVELEVTVKYCCTSFNVFGEFKVIVGASERLEEVWEDILGGFILPSAYDHNGRFGNEYIAKLFCFLRPEYGTLFNYIRVLEHKAVAYSHTPHVDHEDEDITFEVIDSVGVSNPIKFIESEFCFTAFYAFNWHTQHTLVMVTSCEKLTTENSFEALDVGLIYRGD